MTLWTLATNGIDNAPLVRVEEKLLHQRPALHLELACL
jgi:hypothetical protein